MKSIFSHVKERWKQILVVLLLGGSILIFSIIGGDRFLDFSFLVEQRAALRTFVEDHYLAAAAVFVTIYMTTAFFVPGAIVLTLAGGFLFGVLPAALFINAGATLGAVLALLISRHMIGNRIQERYAEQLESFNRAIDRHGAHYLLALRIIPVLPFFAVNYLAGLTRIPLKTFLWTTSLGMLPGSLVYAYAGRQLGSISSPEDILSPGVISALVLLGLFVLLPPAFHYLKRLRARR